MTLQLAMSIISPLDGEQVKRPAIGRDCYALAVVGVVNCVCWQIERLLAGRRIVRLNYFSSNSAISMRVVPMFRMPRVVPGSCQ